ncbi:hypothetical protein S245_065713 [Arachis hypogaea]|uniref:Translocon at the outer membrane of chloroplasts n=1 Tax=Arachis hypogaea TaxID=3818 RepID=A0A6B9V4D8_ARAHY|nr:Translocon at the outer membrane of chloroplasts [Arachis hypogaea]
MSKCILEEVELERCLATIPIQLMIKSFIQFRLVCDKDLHRLLYFFVYIFVRLLLLFSYENFRIFQIIGELFFFADFQHALVLEPTNKMASSTAERLRKLFQ